MTRAGRRGPRQRWSLRTTLVVSCVALIAVVCAVIGTVTAIALHSFLQARLDDELAASVQRSYIPGGHGNRSADGRDDVRFVAMPGQPIGTVGARTDGHGRLTAAARSTDADGASSGGPSLDPRDRMTSLNAAQAETLGGVPLDGAPHTVALPGLGDYRVQAGPGPSGYGRLLVGLPMKGTESTLSTLIVIEVCVTAAGLVAAGMAGAVTVRVALRPLRRVAATATRVAELCLDRGEVEVPHRVPAQDTDPRTEVGQVGAALNRMLGHVGSALAARQESETRVRRFVADASHELRTPLASIRGYAELTRRARAGPAGSADTRHALARIEGEAARMTGLVEDLLLLARLDAGRPLERADVGLSALVVDAVSDARAAGPGHRWRLALPPYPVEVCGDGARIQQVLVNLLANARTHTPEGTEVTARISTERAGAVAVVEVEDAGPGITVEVLPHIFERFARGDAARSRAHGSTGLGLAIVQAVVTAHGGDVRVESEPGRTVFAVRLPAAGAAGSSSQAVHRCSTRR